MTKKLSIAGLALLAALWVAHSVVGCVGDAPNVPAPDASGDGTSPPPPPDGKKANGIQCGAGGECASGNCVDGVCCESACSNVCEKCNLPGSTGTCAAVPAGQDPDNECPTVPLAIPDAGTPDPDASAADASDAASDVVVDTGTPINLPDGGVTVNESLCAGKCNGQRACAYPSSATTCGSTFCNTGTTQGRPACDGQGHCLLGVDNCTAYSCYDGADGGTRGNACNTSCTSPADCLATHYCDGPTATCKPRLANGATCNADPQCQSGFCVSGVCCNDACNGYPGATCTQAGSVGTCRCSACATGPCKLWYPDKDGDGFGDKNAVLGTPPNGAIPGCVTGADGGAPSPPAAGYVQDNTDCYDVADTFGPSVRPGQTGYFQQGYGPGNTNFDFNCDGQTTKETAEFPGGSCGFCSGVYLNCNKSSTCSSAGQQSAHNCSSFSSCGNPPRICLGCYTGTTTGFRANVACGTQATRYTCGTCTTAGGSATQSTTAGVFQRCR
jgi:hypothetical protein